MITFNITNSHIKQFAPEGDNHMVDGRPVSKASGVQKRTLTKEGEPTSPRIVYVTAGDWSGLYIDGKLAAEDERLGVQQLVERARLEHLIEIRSVDPVWFEGREDLPVDLADVEFDRLNIMGASR